MNKTFKLFLYIQIISIFIANGQKVEFELNGRKYEYYTFNSPAESNRLLVLFNWGNGNAETIPSLTNIPETAEKNSIAVIGISFTESFLPMKEFENIDKCIEHAMKTYAIPNGQLYVGGFSAGGEVAARYTEILVEKKLENKVPKGIFIGDSPLDYIEFWKYCDREINRKCNLPASEVGIREAKYVKNYYQENFGDPLKDRNNFIAHSPVTISEPDMGNGKYLINVPIRIYHELDPMWNIKEKCRTAIDGHLMVSTELINYLYHNGNKDAEIIITQNKGYRPNGMRHPHSWSIIDADELIKWINSLK